MDVTSNRSPPVTKKFVRGHVPQLDYIHRHARTHTHALTYRLNAQENWRPWKKGRESPSCSQCTMFLWRPLLAETNMKPADEGDRVQFHKANQRSSLEVRGNNLIIGTRDINIECCKYFP